MAYAKEVGTFTNLFNVIGVNREDVPQARSDKGILLATMATSTFAARCVAVLTLVVLFGVSLPSEAQAQDDVRVAVVDVDVLRSTSGASVVPMRVTVLSQRAIEAVLEIRISGSNLRWELPIALAANSELEQLITVPSSPGSSWTATATLFADGEEIAEDVQNSGGANANAVGVLGIAAPGDEAQLTPDTGIASLIELNDLRIISGLDTVVASPAGIQALTAEEQAELLTWVSSGRQLLVADSAGSIDSLLPESWRVNQSIVPAGTGLIRYVSATDWSSEITPGVTSAASAQTLTGGFDSSAQELLSDGGFRVPSLRILALLLVVYLLLAGPITFAVLTSKKKQTLAWAVIPALAVLFTGGVFVAGRMLNSGRSDAHATVVALSPVGATATDTVLISRSGSRSVTLPQGWTVAGTGTSNRFGNDGASTPITIRPSRTSTDVRFDIETGSGGLAVLRGFTTDIAADALSLSDLEIATGELTGSIRNNTGEDLDHVTVMVGNRDVQLGTVNDGATETFVLSIDGNPPGQFAPELRDWDVDPRLFNNFGFNNELSAETTDGAANGTSWLDWRGSSFGAAVPEGLITAVGWSRDLNASIIGGRGRTAIVQHDLLPTSSDPLAPAQVRAIRMEIPAGDPFDGGFQEGFGGGRSTMVTQFIRPANGDASALAIDLRRNISEMAVWIDGEWRAFKIDNGSGPSVRIPEDAWQGDTLTIQYGLSEFFGDPNQLTTRLTVVGNNTEDLELLAAGETSSRQANFDDDFEQFGNLIEGVRTVVEIPPDAGELFEFSMEGELAASYDAYVVDLTEGDAMTVRMNASNEFLGGSQLDPFLRLLNGDGEEIMSNDDSDGLNSRIDFVAPVDGQYTIETRPLSNNGGGQYVVEIDVQRVGGDS